MSQSIILSNIFDKCKTYFSFLLYFYISKEKTCFTLQNKKVAVSLRKNATLSFSKNNIFRPNVSQK